MRLSILLFIVFSMALAACVPSQTETLNSGIEGRTYIGPTCPVVNVDTPCPDQPYQASFIVYDNSEREVIRFETDADGWFRILLKPGNYILHPETPEGSLLPFSSEQPFTVLEGQFTSLIVKYDSGIR